jgi:hypothetical protein
MTRAALFLLCRAFMLVSSMALLPVALLLRLLTAPFDRRLRALHRFACFRGSLDTRLKPLWDATIAAAKAIDPRAVDVTVCNHRSLADILVRLVMRRTFGALPKRGFVLRDLPRIGLQVLPPIAPGRDALARPRSCGRAATAGALRILPA